MMGKDTTSEILVKCRFCGMKELGNKGEVREDGTLLGECRHCSFQVRQIRQRLLQEILKEINYYIKHYGLQNWGGSDIKNAKELLKFSDKLKSLIK